MKNKFIKTTLISGVLLAVFTTSIVSGADAGSSSDPIVTKSYVDAKVADLKSYVDTSLASMSSVNNGGSSSAQYEVVLVPKGKSIIGGEGTEMILRSGKASVVSTTTNGLVDMTTGIDALNGSAVTQNHLMIVPRDDGRGLKVTSDNTNIMVRGSYEIK